MPKQNIINTNFTSGEVSPIVRGRVDAQKYANGLEKCENFIVKPQGPICRRSGTKFLGPTKYPNQKSILIPFEYSDQSGYVLELGKGYIHIWKNDGLLFETTNTEVEEFEITTEPGGLLGIEMKAEDMPCFGSFGAFKGVGECYVSQNKDGKLRLTTTLPHTLRPGVTAPSAFLTKRGEITAHTNNGNNFVRVTSVAHKLAQGEQITITRLNGQLLPYFQGTYSIDYVNADQFDIAYSYNSGSTAFVASWISTQGGVKTVTALGNAENGRTVVTSNAHGFSNGQAVAVYGYATSWSRWTSQVVGFWRIDNVTANTFELIGTDPAYLLQPSVNNNVYAARVTEVFAPIYPFTIVNDFTIDGTVDAARYVDGWASVAFTGLLVGDRVYVSGATDTPEIKERFVTIHQGLGWTGSTTNANNTKEKVVTSIPRVTSGNDPAGEELWTIPIEISTDYGYTPRKAITSITDSSGLIKITVPGHTYETGDQVEVFLSRNAADGLWTITKIDRNSFTLVGSTYKSNSSYGYTRKPLVLDDELEKISYAQSSDVIYLMHPDHPVKKLIRLSNDGDRNDWQFVSANFKDGPYLPVNSLAPKWDSQNPENGSRYPSVYFEISNYSHTASVNVAAETYPFVAGDAGKFLEYRDGDQWRLAKIVSLEGDLRGAQVEIIDNVLLFLDQAIKYTGSKRITSSSGLTRRVTYDAGSPNMTPTYPGAGVKSKTDPNAYLESNGTKITSTFANTFGVQDVGKYVRFYESGTKWALITKVDPAKPGNECHHAAAETMCDNNANGKFVIFNEKRTATVKSYKDGLDFSAFSASDVGRHIRIGWGGRWTWGVISAFTNASTVSVLLYEDVPRDVHDAKKLAGADTAQNQGKTGRSYDWRLGSWSETTGYPSCGVFHEQRLWFGKTATQPQSVWGSISGDFENFSPTEIDSTVLDDHAVNFTIASTKSDSIRWMVSGPAMTIGTMSGEWQVKSSNLSSEPITPLNVVVVPHTGVGSSVFVKPVKVGSSIIFADRSAKKVSELVYDYQYDGLVAKDLTYLSEHILRTHGGVVSCVYQQSPNSICWFLLEDGTLSSLTINKEQDVFAWHHHEISNGFVESIVTVPAQDLSYDNLYLIVKRNVADFGSPPVYKRYVELLQKEFEPLSNSSLYEMRFLDGYTSFDNVNSNGQNQLWSGQYIYGLQHLNGRSVSVLLNGQLYGPFTVSSGAINLIETFSNKEAVVGLAYTSTAKSLPPEGGSAFGVSQGKIKKLAKYNVRLLNSLALDYGFNANSQTLNSLTNLHENGTSTDFYTGTKELIPNNPYDAESQWTLSTSKPYPLNVLSVTLTVETGE